MMSPTASAVEPRVRVLEHHLRVTADATHSSGWAMSIRWPSSTISPAVGSIRRSRARPTVVLPQRTRRRERRSRPPRSRRSRRPPPTPSRSWLHMPPRTGKCFLRSLTWSSGALMPRPLLWVRSGKRRYDGGPSLRGPARPGDRGRWRANTVRQRRSPRCAA